jgi:hypothetical protein
MSDDKLRIPTDAAVVIRSDFKVDPEAGRKMVEQAKELLARINSSLAEPLVVTPKP